MNAKQIELNTIVDFPQASSNNESWFAQPHPFTVPYAWTHYTEVTLTLFFIESESSSNDRQVCTAILCPLNDIWILSFSFSLVVTSFLKPKQTCPIQ